MIDVILEFLAKEKMNTCNDETWEIYSEKVHLVVALDMKGISGHRPDSWIITMLLHRYPLCIQQKFLVLVRNQIKNIS